VDEMNGTQRTQEMKNEEQF